MTRPLQIANFFIFTMYTKETKLIIFISISPFNFFSSPPPPRSESLSSSVIWKDVLSQQEPFSPSHIFPHWNPRSGRGPCLDLLAFLLCLPGGFSGQCHNSAGHQDQAEPPGAHVLLSGHPFHSWFGPFYNLRAPNAGYLLVWCTRD